MMRSVATLICLSSGAFHVSNVMANEPEVVDTQDPDDIPLAAKQSLRDMTFPEGFEVTLFAAEPDIRQPIALDIDDRGRLWVVECYSYAGGPFDDSLRDRILIFDDTDGDGRFDQRKIFWDHGTRVTGLALGFGGVWITNAPHLSFLPRRGSRRRS